MKKPNPKAYGQDNELWEKGGKKAYEAAYLQWAEYCAKYEIKRLPGRRRDAPVHPSWTDYVAHFDPTDPTRSQNAFCNWAKIRPSSLSSAKRKSITDRMDVKLSEWIEEQAKTEKHEQQQ